MFVTQAQVLNANKDPAAYMFNLAKRWGFNPAAKDNLDDIKTDEVTKGHQAQSMGGGEVADDEAMDDEDLTDDEFLEAFGEKFGKR